MMARCLGLLALAVLAADPQELHLPWGPATPAASPDGSKILFGVPYRKGVNQGPQLWIEDNRTHQRTKLFDIGSTLSAGWSPDGAAFYVNDRLASDTERAYFYDAATLKRVDIAARILAEDPASRRFAGDHAYFEVTGWDGPPHVAVSFFGHTTGPVRCFQFRYRVTPSGIVEKLSQHTFAATAKSCSEAP